MPWTWNLHTREFWPERDLKKYPVWFLNRGHSYPAYTPLFMWTWCFSETRGVWYGVNEAWIPTTRGHEMRDINGCSLEGALRITDEKEIKERRKHFYKFIRSSFGPNFNKIWNDIKVELTGHYIKLQTFDYKKATQWELFKQFQYGMQVLERMWALHFYLLYAVYGAYWEFMDLVEAYCDLDGNAPLFQKLVRGYDNDLFIIDKAIWDLRNRAIEIKIDDVFRNNPATEVISQLKKTSSGRTWLDKDLYDFLLVKGYGWKQPRMMEFINPAWWEDPTPVIQFVQKYLLMQGGSNAVFPLDNIRPRLIKEREEVEKKILKKAQAGGCKDMPWFKTVMQLAQRTSYVSESHDWMCECQCFPSFRYALLQIGERLLKYGTVTEPSDLFFFIPEELESMINLPENYDMREIAQERRANWQAQYEYASRPSYHSKEPISPDELEKFAIDAKDPVVTLVSIGAPVKPRPETGAILFGNSGNAGIAEGTARICVTNADIAKFEPGDIMVCPATHASWSTIFPLLKGVIADGSGIAHHTAIIGREYDIPVVMNTEVATRMLKDGERIRIDATQGLVFRLNK
jgi:phosphohistidine swiveling domain-containing protein